MSKNEGNNRREFLKKSAAAAAGLGLLGFGIKAQPLMLNSPPENAANRKNMMVVGMKTAYISPLPMFDGLNKDGTDCTSPHRRQVIMEATFTQGKRNMTDIYFKDRLTHPAVKMYTLKPADFVLGRVDPNGMALRTFRGLGLFRGHLERPGHRTIIGVAGDEPAEGVFDVNVKKVVHFHKFDPNATKPTVLEYLLFGKGSELFMAHFITKPDDFDQIISVKIPGNPFSEAQLSDGIHVVFSSRGNTALERMKEKHKGPGEFQLPGETAKTLPVEVVREFYFEESELAVPPTFNPSTEEEKKSGFP